MSAPVVVDKQGRELNIEDLEDLVTYISDHETAIILDYDGGTPQLILNETNIAPVTKDHDELQEEVKWDLVDYLNGHLDKKGNTDFLFSDLSSISEEIDWFLTQNYPGWYPQQSHPNYDIDDMVRFTIFDSGVEAFDIVVSYERRPDGWIKFLEAEVDE